MRQRLLYHMIQERGYPKGLLSVEKKILSRRYDLVCYSPEMKPLLLVECKAGELDEAAAHQASGYNFWLQAPFICLAGSTKILTFWQEKEGIKSVSFLPKYEEVYAISRRR